MSPIFRLLILFAIAVAGLAAYLQLKPLPAIRKADQGASLAVQPATDDEEKNAKMASIGGPFTLTDQNGTTVTQKALLGHFSLISFGYSFCPDVCPMTLNTMTTAIESLDSTGINILPLFVSVDPGRDTPKVLKEYASHFHPRLLALTGTKDQIKEAAAAYKVFYDAHPVDADDKNYLLDHSSFIYLMGPDGSYITHFPYDVPIDVLVKSLRQLIAGAPK